MSKIAAEFCKLAMVIILVVLLTNMTVRSGNTVESKSIALDKISRIEKELNIKIKPTDLFGIYYINDSYIYAINTHTPEGVSVIVFSSYSIQEDKIINNTIPAKMLFGDAVESNLKIIMSHDCSGPYYIFVIENYPTPGISEYYSEFCILYLEKDNLILKYKSKINNANGWEIDTSSPWKITSEIGHAYQSRIRIYMDTQNKKYKQKVTKYKYNQRIANKVNKQILEAWKINEDNTDCFDYAFEIDDIETCNEDYKLILDTGLLVGIKYQSAICASPLIDNMDYRNCGKK